MIARAPPAERGSLNVALAVQRHVQAPVSGRARDMLTRLPQARRRRRLPLEGKRCVARPLLLNNKRRERRRRSVIIIHEKDLRLVCSAKPREDGWRDPYEGRVEGERETRRCDWKQSDRLASLALSFLIRVCILSALVIRSVTPTDD